MKKKISIILLFYVTCVLSLAVFAGSIDVDLVADDEALVFIGSVDECQMTDAEEDYPDAEYSLTLTPNKKLKGDVIIDKPMDFEKVRTGKLRLQKNANYLFGWMRNELYIWELEPYNNLLDWEFDDYTEDSIILKERHNNSIAEGMQSFLNEGVFERAEIERQTLGKQKSFADFLGPDLEASERIVFSFRGEHYEVDRDKFIELAKGIQITNVKNETLKSTNYEHVLYIRGENEDGTSCGDAYAAVAPYGEVDKHNMGMSRLIVSDYKIETKDIENLYSLLPFEAQEKIPEFHVMPETGDKPVTVVNTALAVLIAVLVTAVIIIILLLSKSK